MSYREVFFAIMDFKMNKKIPKTSVEEIWRYVGTFENMRKLFCEIIARGEMTIEDEFFIFSKVGDLEARMLKYSLNLERQLKRKRKLDYVAPIPREVRFY